MTGDFSTSPSLSRYSLLCRVYVVFALLTLRLCAADAGALAKGEAALKRANYDEALAVFDGILQADPTNAAAHVGRGRCYGGRNDLEHALADFNEALRLDPKSIAAHSFRYQAYFSRNEFEKALGDIDAMIELAPSDAQYRRGRAYLYSRQKNYALALADSEKAIALDRKDIENIKIRAGIFAEARSYREAIEDFSTAIGMDGRDDSCFFRRGWVYEKIGSYREAIDDLREALRLDKKSQMYANSLAWLLATCPEEKYRDGPEAVELATRACELTLWKEPGMLDTLAAAYARCGNFDRAVDWQAKAADLVTDDVKAADFRDRLARYNRQEAYVEDRRETDKAAWSLQRSACFATVWTTVNENYFDATFGGVDWLAVREKYRLRLWEAADNRMLRGLLQSMLGELHRTHFAIMPREMSVLQPEERGRIGYTGAEASSIEGMIAIVRVKPGSPADQAGLKPGDIVRRVDTVVLSEMAASMSESVPSTRKQTLYLRSFVNWRLAAPVGKTVELQLEAPDGTLREVKLVAVPFEGVWSEAMGFAPSEPIECEAGAVAPGVVRLRFNTFALPVMAEFKRCVRSLKPGDGLVLDLRGNPGGLTLMAPGICGRLSEKEVSLGTMHKRFGVEEFTAYPQPGAFTGPVAVLVDSASASTSEILAAGLQAFGRARLFGELTAGAALPSMFRQLPNGDMLQYAVADIKTPQGVLIEGSGVTPDELVTVRRADCIAGRDPVLEAAERWIATQPQNQGGAAK